MHRHGVLAFLLVLAVALCVAGGPAQAGPATRDDAAARNGSGAGQTQQLTGFGGILERRLEVLLGWVRSVFGDGDEGPMSGTGLTDDPDPTSTRLGTDPEAAFEKDPAEEQEEGLEAGDDRTPVTEAFTGS